MTSPASRAQTWIFHRFGVFFLHIRFSNPRSKVSLQGTRIDDVLLTAKSARWMIDSGSFPD